MEKKIDLKQKTISGVFWQLLQKGSSQIVTFVVSVLLARLVQPSEFGVVAITSIFLTIAGVLTDSGLGASLVQKKNVDDLDKNTVFFFGLFISIIFYGILFFCAPLIARMYKTDLIVPILRIIGLSLLLSSFSSVQSSLVMREMDFRKYFYATLASTIISAAVGLSLAFKGYGVWALVFQNLVKTFSSVLVLFFLVRWIPCIMFSWQRLKRLYSFGLNLTAASLVGTIFNELRGFLIGLRFMPADLAFYNRGNSLPGLINDNVNGTISTVLFPAIAQLQDDKNSVKNSMRRAMMTSTFFIAPLMTTLAATSKQIVLLLYTETWSAAIPFMQVICMGYIFSVLGSANLQAINAIGRTDITFKLEFIKKPLYLLLIIMGLFISPLAIAAGNTVYSIIGSAINAIPNKKLIGYSYREQITDIFPQLIFSIIAGGAAWCIGCMGGNLFLIFAMQLIISAGIYLSLARIFRIESLCYIIETLYEYTTSQKNL